MVRGEHGDDQLNSDELPVDRELLRAVLAHVDDLVMTVRPDGEITFVSPAVTLLLGYDPTEVEGQSILDFLHPDEHDEVLAGMARWVNRSGAPRGQVQHIRAADGRWIGMHYDVVAGDAGSAFGGFITTMRPAETHDPDRHDLVQRLLNEDRLVRLATVFLERAVDDFEEGMRAALHELSGLEYITRVSVWHRDGDRVVRRGQWEAKAAAPRTALPPHVPLDGTPVLRRLTAGEEVHIRSVDHLPDDWSVERIALQAAGVRSMLAVPMVIEGAYVGFVMGEITIREIAFDVTQIVTLRSAAAILAAALRRHEAEAELARRARTDLLTGLPNRWVLLDAVDRGLEALRNGTARGLAVALLDIDRFTMVNDAFGHEVGDRLLVSIADRLRRAAGATEPDGGVVLGRMHGDEFLFVLADVATPDAAVAAIQPIADSLAAPFEVDGRPVQLDASVGIAFSREANEAARELLQRADLVMQRARESGGFRIAVEDAPLHLSAKARVTRHTQLRQAIEADAITVHYQAEWDMATGRIVGAEALARWPHPDEGLLVAGEFIPLAEESGSIIELGANVLHRACRDATTWPEAVDLRVNLSARQLHQADVRGVVASALERSGLPPERLCLELTETALLHDPAHAVGVLDALRSDGIGLAIDDFGIGYSSLLYLKRLPVTGLKIDRSFVSGLPVNADDRAIVRAIVQLAETLGIGATAEGVETAEQRDALVELGCNRAQGFLLSRPEPAGEFVARFDVTDRVS